MEWLRKLIEGAKKNEDGSIDIDDLMKQVNIEFPKNAVPKNTYNDVSEQLKTANATITDLKKNNVDNEALQQTINEHETTIKNLKENASKTEKEYALKDKLKDLGVTDAEYIIYKHGGIDKFSFDGENKPIGIEDTIKPYKESIPHIFKTDKIETHYDPAAGNGDTTVTKEQFQKMGYTERVALYNENKELYNKLSNE